MSNYHPNTPQSTLDFLSGKICFHEPMLSYSEKNRDEVLSTCRRCGAKIEYDADSKEYIATGNKRLIGLIALNE